ncbi:MAG TPA: acyltransferase [Candidatus Eisenbacteria bacterium]|nr:acyltransferase [Candidatus Eisenbacteria bacterium]
MKKKVQRLSALDGLRGLAIILVFLNHINPQYIIAKFPILDRIGLFSSGVTGVSFLFILSGFLMSYLYPRPVSGWEFLQKRYTRIFPLFLSMCGCMFFFFLFPQLHWSVYIFILFFIAGFIHIVWVYSVKRINSQFFSKVLFFFFLLVQGSVGLVYVFWIMRKPPLFFQQLPIPFRDGFIGLVNATLTFPLGNYIPMLDGVYWSLAAEILFYALYPLLVVPIVWLLFPRKKIVKVIFLLSLIPFLAAVDMLSHHILVLSALQFSLFYYFATGIALAFLYKRYAAVFEKISDKMPGILSYVPIVLLFAVLIGIHILNSITSSGLGPWIRLLFAIPITLLVASALDKKTLLGKFLGSKILVFLGTISYSIYLSHAIVVAIVSAFYPSVDIVSNMLFIFISFSIDVGIAFLLYTLLEKPYFLSTHKKVIKEVIRRTSSTIRGKIALGCVLGVSLIAIFFAFQSNYNFFSAVIPSPVTITTPRTDKKILSTREFQHIQLQVVAQDNNLGILTLRIAHPLKINTKVVPLLTFSLIERSTQKQIFSTKYVLDEFRNDDFPFGFPTIIDSKGKEYVVDFSLSPIDSKDYVTIDTQSVKSVYQLDKKSILRHPASLVQLLQSKLVTLFANSTARLSFLLLVPFALLAIILLFA